VTENQDQVSGDIMVSRDGVPGEALQKRTFYLMNLYTLDMHVFYMNLLLYSIMNLNSLSPL